MVVVICLLVMRSNKCVFFFAVLQNIEESNIRAKNGISFLKDMRYKQA